MNPLKCFFILFFCYLLASSHLVCLGIGDSIPILDIPFADVSDHGWMQHAPKEIYSV